MERTKGWQAVHGPSPVKAASLGCSGLGFARLEGIASKGSAKPKSPDRFTNHLHTSIEAWDPSRPRVASVRTAEEAKKRTKKRASRIQSTLRIETPKERPSLHQPG